MMGVLVVVMMGRVGVVRLPHPLATAPLLLSRYAQRLPLLLIPRAQALAAERQIIVVYYYGLHPAVPLDLGRLLISVGDEVVRHVVAVVLRRRCRRRGGYHDERRGVVRVAGVMMVIVVMRMRRRFVRGLVVVVGGRVGGPRLRMSLCRRTVVCVMPLLRSGSTSRLSVFLGRARRVSRHLRADEKRTE